MQAIVLRGIERKRRDVSFPAINILIEPTFECRMRFENVLSISFHIFPVWTTTNDSISVHWTIRETNNTLNNCTLSKLTTRASQVFHWCVWHGNNSYWNYDHCAVDTPCVALRSAAFLISQSFRERNQLKPLATYVNHIQFAPLAYYFQSQRHLCLALLLIFSELTSSITWIDSYDSPFFSTFDELGWTFRNLSIAAASCSRFSRARTLIQDANVWTIHVNLLFMWRDYVWID